MTNTETQTLILNKLMFTKGLKYSELHKVTENHDLFNYSLRHLIQKGYLKKQNSQYLLTPKGKQTVSFMEEDGMYQQQFKVGMFMNIVRKSTNCHEMLLYKRLKHPHYGYIGAVSGKLQWGDPLEENLKRELMEEVSIVPLSHTILGVIRDVFLNENGKKVGDGVYFVIAIDAWEGEPKLSSQEGEYFWCDIDKILDLDKIFKKSFEEGLPHLKRFIKNPKLYTPYVIENIPVGLKY